jgi:hypothetical protein
MFKNGETNALRMYIFFLSVALICRASSRFKGNFEAGLAADEKRDYATAIKELEDL